MKRKLITLFLPACILLFCGLVADYRDACCGNYACRRIYRHVDFNTQAWLIDTSNLVVNVSKNTNDSLLNVDVNGEVFIMKFMNNRIGSIDRKTRCSGTLMNDSISLYHVPSRGPVSFSYVGKK